MTMYEESPLYSGNKGAAFTAVILLHVVFGFALYSELTGRIGKTLDASPLNLTALTETIKEPIKPPPLDPLKERARIYVTPPEFPPFAPQAEPDAGVENPPAGPPGTSTGTQAPPPLGASIRVRMDPRHPLRIGEAYYPDASRRANEMGRCLVKVTVAIDGRIVAAAIQSSTGFARLDQACLNAVRGQRMLPAMEDGKPIENTISIPIVWNLTDK